MRRRWAPLALHAMAFALLLFWSWRKWPDPLVDFGRELYVPWQIGRGRVLYRDIASLFGPLSPYLNALWFRLFGPSLMTLAICNLAIFSAMLAGLYHLLRASTDRVTATAAGLTTLLLFGFSQYVETGNYNFVTPYSHEATHGMALSVALLACLYRTLRTRSRIASATAGLCFGLVLLTKPEIGAAATAAVLAACVAAYGLDGQVGRLPISTASLFIMAAAIPPLLFLAYFATQMDSAAALRATAGAWVPIFGTAITSNDFYRRSMGLDAPVANTARMLLTFAGFIAFTAAAFAISWTSVDGTGRMSARTRILRIALLALVILVMRPGTFPRALPLIVISTLVAVVMLFVRARRDRDRAVRLTPLIMCAVFALVLLAKMGLNARVEHYGFYLGLPAMAVAIALVSWLIPHLLTSWRSDTAGRTFRQLALWALAAVIAPYLGLEYGWYRTKTLAVASGSDRFYASTLDGLWQGRAVRDALDVLAQNAAPGDTLAVLPEGVMLNYLARLDSPLRVINLMPPEVMAFGEDDVLRSLAARPPDFVLLVHRDTSEYGYPPFGRDPRYGLGIVDWINERYDGVRRIGPPGAADAGMQLLKRRSR